MKIPRSAAIFLGLAVLAASAAPLAAQSRDESAKTDEDSRTWTNEDLQALDRHGVSFLGSGGISAPLEIPERRPADWWRQRANLYAERLEDLDARIATIQDRLARASNPFTRAMAGTVETPEGGERLATAADLKAELERLRGIRQTELRGLGALQRAAADQGVPVDWVEVGEAASAEARQQQPLFVSPRHGIRDRDESSMFVDPRSDARKKAGDGRGDSSGGPVDPDASKVGDDD